MRTMRWWWAGAYGAFKKKRPSDRVAKPSGKTVVLVVGYTATVGASLLDNLPFEDTPGEPFKAYAISCHPFPPSSPALPPGVLHCRSDLADPKHLAVALEHLTNYVASDPRHTNAAGREANMAVLRDALSCLFPNCTKLADVCLLTSRVGPFEPLSTAQLPELLRLGDGLEGARISIIKEMDLPDDINNWSFMDSLFDVEIKHLDTTNRSNTGFFGFRNKVRYMAGRRALCLTFLLFIMSSFISTVNAEDGLHKCPTRSIIDSLPRNTCQVIKLTGDHWSHSKRVYPKVRDDNDYHIVNPFGYFFENEFTWCTRSQDMFQLLGILSFWPAVWKLRQNQYVRFMSDDKSLIVIWIDTSIAGIFYHVCWILYGHLLSASGGNIQSDFGQHVHHLNLIGCTLFMSVLLMLLFRHRTIVKASRFILYRLLGLVFLVMIFYCLRGIEPDEKNIFRVGALGFGAMILMYTMKSFTVVGLKMSTMIVNIVTIFLFVCCEHHHLRSWYGCSYIGSLFYRVLETARFCLLYHQERLAGGRLHRQ